MLLTLILPASAFPQLSQSPLSPKRDQAHVCNPPPTPAVPPTPLNTPPPQKKKKRLRSYPQQHAVLSLVLAPRSPRATLVEPSWNLTSGIRSLSGQSFQLLRETKNKKRHPPPKPKNKQQQPKKAEKNRSEFCLLSPAFLAEPLNHRPRLLSAQIHPGVGLREAPRLLRKVPRRPGPQRLQLPWPRISTEIAGGGGARGF